MSGYVRLLITTAHTTPIFTATPGLPTPLPQPGRHRRLTGAYLTPRRREWWKTPEKQLCVICLSSLSLHKYFLSTHSMPDLGDVMTDDKDESSILTKLVVEGVA